MAEYAKFVWASPDKMSGEPQALRRTFWIFAGHFTVKCAVNTKHFTGHFKVLDLLSSKPLAGYFSKFAVHVQ